MAGKHIGLRRTVIRVLLAILSVYALVTVLGLWGREGDPLLHLGRSPEGLPAAGPLMHIRLGVIVDLLAAYRHREGTYPPRDQPYAWSAENLYYHLMVRPDPPLRPAERLPKQLSAPGAQPGRRTFVDIYGNPIHYDQPAARNGDLPFALWSAGKDRRERTSDDFGTWMFPDLRAPAE